MALEHITDGMSGLQAESVIFANDSYLRGLILENTDDISELILQIVASETAELKDANPLYNFAGFIKTSSDLTETLNNVYTAIEACTVESISLAKGERLAYLAGAWQKLAPLDLHGSRGKIAQFSFAEAGSDLAKSTTYASGYVNSAGGITANSAYQNSDYIRIKGQASVNVSNHATEAGAYLSFTDAKYVVVQLIAGASANGNNVPPAGAVYLRGTVLTGQKLKITAGNDFDVSREIALSFLATNDAFLENFSKLSQSSYAVAGSNISLKAVYTSGYVNSTGGITANSSFEYTGLTYCKGQASINVSNHSTNSATYLCFYDANGVALSPKYGGASANATIVPPAGATHYRASVLTGQRVTVIAGTDVDVNAQQLSDRVEQTRSQSTVKIPSSKLLDDELKKVDVKMRFENDWYDPNFKHTYIYEPLANITANSVDFALGLTKAVSTKYLGEHCLRIQSGQFSLQLISPSFSTNFFKSLGYAEGDVCKVGLWVKLPFASPSSVRNVYTAVGVFTAITDTDWHWLEIDNAITVNFAINWQTVYFGVQGATAGQAYYIKGLTLVNTSKKEWVGEQASMIDQTRNTLAFINQNPFVEKIATLNCPLYTQAYESSAKAFTKEIISISDLPCEIPKLKTIEGIRFTGTGALGSDFNLNTFLSPTNFATVDNYLLPTREGYFVAGYWLRLNNVQTSNRPTLYDANYTGMVSDLNFDVPQLEANVWHWIEMPPRKVSEGIKNTHYKIVISVRALSDSETPSFDIAGVTWGYIENPFAFRFTTNNIAKNSRFYKKKYTCLGDSIPTYNYMQQIVGANFCTINTNRGIGSTTICNKTTGTGSQAYVDSEGNFLAYPPATQPVGSTLIEASICRQQRIDTIPTDTEFLTIWAGTNDWNAGYALGSITDTASDAVGNTFWAGYKSVINKIYARIPNASIFLINITHRQNETTTQNSAGLYLEQYREVVRGVGKYYGIPVIETNDLGVNDINWSSYALDTVHPNEKYHQLIGGRVCAVLQGYNQPSGVTGN